MNPTLNYYSFNHYSLNYYSLKLNKFMQTGNTSHLLSYSK